MVFGQPQEASHLILGGHHGGGNHAGQAFGAGRQKDVPNQRVHRCAGDHAHPVEVLVHRRHDRQVHGDDEDHRHLAEALEQIRGARVGRVVACHHRLGIDRRFDDGIERRLASGALCGIEAHGRTAELAEPLA